MELNTLLNNTLLIPASDGLASLRIPSVDLVNVRNDNLATTELLGDRQESFACYIKVNDGASEKFIGVSSITGMEMKRKYESKPVVNSDYIVQMPGQMEFNQIRLEHFFTRDCFFLKWMTSGLTEGGSPRADIEIHIIPTNGSRIVITCYDAFPSGWTLDGLSAGNDDTVINETVMLEFSGVNISIDR